VHCCQICPRYTNEKIVKIENVSFETVATSTVQTEIKQNPYAKILEQANLTKEVQAIPKIDHQQIVEDSLQDANKIIILPKNPNIKISIKELLGQEEDENKTNN